MKRPDDPFVDHVLELLRPLGAMQVKRMFGGWGIYADDRIFGLIAWDRLFLKTDALTRARFEAEGCEPFGYEAKGRPVVVTSYWEPPSEALDDAELMRPWAELALAASRRAPAPKPKRKR